MPCLSDEIKSLSSRHKVSNLDIPKEVPPLTSLYIYVSDSCNLACRHCWITPSFQHSSNDGQFVKLSYVHKAIIQAKPIGLHSVKLTGGEPTLHPQFRKLVTMIDKEGIKIIIETNGILVDRKLARFLKEKDNISFISISIDGASADTHDALRGVSGCYEQALSGIESLVEVGFHPQLICTLHRGNVSEIKEVVTMAEKLGCGSVKFNIVQEVGRGENFVKEHGLEVQELIRLYHKFEKEIIPKSKISIFFDIPVAFYSIHKMLHGSLDRCTVLNILSVLSGGELSLCGIGVTVPELIFGHIEDSNLQEVWFQSSGLVQLREKIPIQLEGICKNCLHQDICLGNCVANNFYLTGRLNAPYVFCDRAEALGLFPASRKKQ